MNREEKLERSMLGMDDGEFLPYTVGRKRILRLLGNPFFGGGGDDWDFEEQLGVAFVVFTEPVEKVRKIAAKPNAREEFREIWENAHGTAPDRVYRWVMKQEGLVEAAMTEAAPGKPEEGGKQETPQTG
jgi:hypothetical protein